MSLIIPRLVELSLTMTLTFIVVNQDRTNKIQKRVRKTFNSLFSSVTRPKQLYDFLLLL